MCTVWCVDDGFARVGVAALEAVAVAVVVSVKWETVVRELRCWVRLVVVLLLLVVDMVVVVLLLVLVKVVYHSRLVFGR